MSWKTVRPIGLAPTVLLFAGLALAQTAGPAPGARFTEAYLRHVARDVTFWAWPMVDLYNRRSDAGILPAADVVTYGVPLALDKEPVVVQVPDFGERFWIGLAADLRTDAFANLGSMYGTKPGFYLLVGPKWNGETPPGIVRVFHARTSSGFLVARVVTTGAKDDLQAATALLSRFDTFPLSQFDGKEKPGDGRSLHPPGSGDAMAPPFAAADFFERLPAVLQDAPPLPGEDARYGEARALLAAMKKDPKIKAAALEEAARAGKELIEPLFEFGTLGLPLANNWTAVLNGADFGTDYYGRTAAARADPFLNRSGEAMTFYLDRDRGGVRLNGAHRYTVTFTKATLPPVRASWSLSLYDARHGFVARAMAPVPAADGSLAITVQADEPGTAQHRANWLQAPKGADFSLVLRAWWPESGITSGRWTPPPAIEVK